MRLRHLFAVALAALIVSCEVKMPDNVMPPGEMEEFLYDYHLVQAMTNRYSSYDYMEKLHYNYVFDKHNISKERFDSSMLWYNRYPKHLKRIYENLEAKLEKEVEMLNNARATLVDGVSLDVAYLAEDSADIWTSSKIKQLLATPLNSKLSFSFEVPKDTTFVEGDSLSFSFTAYFIPSSIDSLVQKAYSAIRLDYADGTVYTKSLTVDASREYHLSAPRYAKSKLKSMSGFVYYSDNDSTAQARLLLADISVVRIHPKQESKKVKKRR